MLVTQSAQTAPFRSAGDQDARWDTTDGVNLLTINGDSLIDSADGLTVSGIISGGAANDPITNDKVLTLIAMPEPGMLVSLAGGFATLLGLQRWRRRG